MDAFETFSRMIGRRLSLVQGAGGNTSIKSGGVMRIKASGAWLADAGEKEIFVNVDLAPLRGALAGDFDDATLKVALNAEGALRPSIETPLHALSPFAVVAHVHSANTIAWSVQKDARARLSEKLSGLSFALIAYRRPGAPLALAVREAFADARPHVLVFANHGLVVAGDSVEETAALLEEVERRLDIAPAIAEPPMRHSPPAPPPGYQWADQSPAAFLAYDAARAALVAAGSLYPDHVVFLGPGMALAENARAVETLIPPPRAVIVAGEGVLVRADLTKGALAMLDCLGLVAARLAPDAALSYLSDDDERELLGWDAEAFRQALDRRASKSGNRTR